MSDVSRANTQKAALPFVNVAESVQVALEGMGLSLKQAQAMIYSDARVNLSEGAVRAGKTIGQIVSFIMHVAASADIRGELVAMGNTRESVGRNVFGPMQDPTLMGPLASLVHYTPGAPSAVVLGKKVHVIGAHDVRAEKVIRGMTVAGALIDELTLISKEMWKQLLARLTDKGAKVFATTNPDSPLHWVKTDIIDRAKELGYRVFTFAITDNLWLLNNNPDYIEQLAREYVPGSLWYQRFYLGRWVAAEGAVYTSWDHERMVIPAGLLPQMTSVLALGIDIGVQDATRGLELSIGPAPDGQGEALYLTAEWAPPTGRSDAQYSADLSTWKQGRPHPARYTYVDSAASHAIVQFRNDKHRGVAGADKAPGSVLAGIRTIDSLLAAGRLFVSDACVEFLKEIGGYRWDAKAAANGVDKPLDGNDHALDAGRYAIYSSRHLWRTRIPVAPAAPDAPGSNDLLEDTK